MADTIISTDGLTSLNNAIKDTQYTSTVAAFNNKDYISDKLTQLNDANEARFDATTAKITDADYHNEARSTRSVDELLAESRFIDIGAARRADAAQLQLSNTASANVIAQHLGEFQASSQADRIAQAEVVASYTNTTRLAQAIEAVKDEARDAAQAAVMSSYVTREAVHAEGDATRALMNHQYSDGLRDQLQTARNALIEVRGDVRHWEHEGRRYERDSFNNAISGIGNQINNLHQAAQQGTVNFGTMSGNAGRNTSTQNIVWDERELDITEPDTSIHISEQPINSETERELDQVLEIKTESVVDRSNSGGSGSRREKKLALRYLQ